MHKSAHNLHKTLIVINAKLTFNIDGGLFDNFHSSRNRKSMLLLLNEKEIKKAIYF